GRAVAGHRTGVAEAEIHVLAPVHVDHAVADCAFDGDREAAGPQHHPGHRHAADQRALRTLVQLGRARVLGAEALQLRVEELRQSSAVDHRFQSGLHACRTSTCGRPPEYGTVTTSVWLVGSNAPPLARIVDPGAHT